MLTNNSSLSPCYLVHGIEPVQKQIFIDKIKSQLKNNGYTKLETLVIKHVEDFKLLTTVSNNLSLFDDFQFTEVHLVHPPKKAEHKQTLLHWLTQQLDCTKTALLIICNKLSSNHFNEPWYQLIAKQGSIAEAKPISNAAWPRWLQKQFHLAGFQITAESLQIVSHCYEGNILAITQFIQQLALIYPAGPLAHKEIEKFLEKSNQLHFSIFELIDFAYSGNTKRTLEILHSLKNTYTSTTLILWVLTKEIRKLLALHLKLKQGYTLVQLAPKYGIWPNKIPKIQENLDKLPVTYLKRLMQQVLWVDKIDKGIVSGNVWEALTTLMLKLAKQETLHLDNLLIGEYIL